MKVTELEILAALENARIIYKNDRNADPDWCFRVASAVVASAFGYKNREDWTGEAGKLGLVEYGATWEDPKIALENYKRLCLKMEA